MIIRIFKTTIHPEMRQDFERDFATVSVNAVKAHKGLVSCHIGCPTQWNPDEYAMITVWENESDLAAFAGDDWHKAVIPSAMRKYPRSFSVDHFDLKEAAKGS
ncbi:MAG TPA: antibiotic biosynthesis monooxygenase [Chthoniobacterales bacterium]|jgi:heme-degrading monooxygenase HmoA